MEMNKLTTILLILLALALTSCKAFNLNDEADFSHFQESFTINNWKYNLRVEELSIKNTSEIDNADKHYLKATLAMGNIKTNKSLLYSSSKSAENYKANYEYLAFQGTNDLYVKKDNETVYPIGYVFEPSNGLNPEERLVYKFVLDESQYQNFKENTNSIEYWYADPIVGNGKICFRPKN